MRTGLMVAAAMVTLTQSAGAQMDLYNCVDAFTRIGANCNSSDSLEVTFENNCPIPVRVYYCVERADGSNRCRTDPFVGVGDQTRDYICNSTGNASYTVCRPHEDC